MNPSETLRLLLSMEPAAIERELKGAEGKGAALAAEVLALLRRPLNAITPETDARLAHLEMVEAHERCRNELLAPELKTFYAAAAASRVVEAAEMAAEEKGTLAELGARITAIERREGLKEDEYWRLNEGPADYRELEAEFGRILKEVGDTIFPFILRRYGLEEQAELFERDRDTFEIQRQTGRRVVYPGNAASEKSSDEYFRKQYGEEALRRVKARTKQIRMQLLR